MKAAKLSNPRGDALPTEGFAIAVDGKIKMSYATSDDALKAGQDIKRKFPVVQVVIFDAKTKERTLVEVPAASDA